MTPPTWLYWPATATAAPWTPSNLGSLRAWYDASDTSTVTESSNLITAWNDKSGGGYHLSASGGDRPTYTSSGLDGKHVVTFGGSEAVTASTASDWNFLHNTTGSTVVAVWKAGTSADPDAIYSLMSTDGGTVNNHGYSLRFDDRVSQSRNESITHIVGRAVGPAANATVVHITANDFHPPNAATILACTSDPGNATAANRSSMRVNGGSPSASNTNTAAASTSNASFALQLGAGGNNAIPLTGYIAEVVIANAKLSDADRERVEGYLAWKWGLEGNLPGGHPFKNAPPTA